MSQEFNHFFMYSTLILRIVFSILMCCATAGQEDPFELDSNLLLSSGRHGEDRKRQYFVRPWNTATWRFGWLTVHQVRNCLLFFVSRMIHVACFSYSRVVQIFAIHLLFCDVGFYTSRGQGLLSLRNFCYVIDALVVMQSSWFLFWSYFVVVV